MVNLNFYILGNPGGTYSQFPDDYTAENLRPLAASTKGWCLRITRNLNIMEYAYVQVLDAGTYIGFNVIFNNAYLSLPLKLLSTFKNLVTATINAGQLLAYNAQGQLQYTVPDFSGIQAIYGRLKATLQQNISKHPDEFGLQVLITTFNGEHTETSLPSDSTDEDILEATSRYNTVIVGDQKIITSDLGQGTKKKSKKEKTKKEKPATASRTPRGLKVFVVVLLLVILGMGLWLFSTYDDLYYWRNRSYRYQERLDQVEEIAKAGGSEEYLNSWTSDNHYSPSRSDYTYYVNVAKDDYITLHYNIDSEGCCDRLKIYVDGDCKFNKGGRLLSGEWTYTFPSAGNYSILVEYSKDSTVSSGEDYGEVLNVTVHRSAAGAILKYLNDGTLGYNQSADDYGYDTNVVADTAI